MANDVVVASIEWAGPRNDVVTVLARSVRAAYGAALTDDPDVVIYRLLDEQGEPEGSVVGVEILEFLHFDRWDELPRSDSLWQIPGRPPLRLVELLKREQRELRSRPGVPDAGRRTA